MPLTFVYLASISFYFLCVLLLFWLTLWIVLIPHVLLVYFSSIRLYSSCIFLLFHFTFYAFFSSPYYLNVLFIYLFLYFFTVMLVMQYFCFFFFFFCLALTSLIFFIYNTALLNCHNNECNISTALFIMHFISSVSLLMHLIYFIDCLFEYPLMH